MRILSISSLRNFPALALACALLGACVETPAPEVVTISPDAHAHALLDEQRYLEAAQAFTELAQNVSSPLTEEYQLQAADALARGGATLQARTLATSITASNLSAELQVRRNLLLGSIALEGNDPALALSWLSADSVQPRKLEQIARYHQIRARSFEQLGQYLTAARELAIVDPLLPIGRQDQNRTEIWLALSRVSVAQLSSVDTSSPTSFEGWITLALIARRLITDPKVFDEAITRWGTSFPTHPAGGMVEELRNASLIDAEPPAHVALLLPLEGGPFAGAATAIRDGFLAAWYQSANASARPKISVFNTADREILEVHAEALAEGVDFVVGPLSKPAVAKLASSAPLSVSTLALNRVDQTLLEALQSAADEEEEQDVSEATAPATGILYEFALSPEEEAERVAERAWSQGHTAAAIMSPTGNWGRRLSEGFARAWRELGGQVVDKRTYESNARDMTEPVSSLLGVDASKERAKTLSRFLGRQLEHIPRRRKDIDFIFMVANPKQARLLRPQFRFHHASRVPVYSTSHVYTGLPNASADIDVEGVRFGDMPWVLKPGGTSGTLRITTEAAWQGSFARYIRFYAFGADAYSVLPHLGTLRAQPFIEFPGETGSLSVNADNQVRRGLSWAHFVEGVPVALEPSSLEEE